jgi:hypothetical protein
MRHLPKLLISLALATTITLSYGATMAQTGTGDALANDPAVKNSQQPESSPQGPRSPSDETKDETSTHPLRDSLAKLRAAPPDLQGNPVPRPNMYASEPGQGSERTRSQDPSDMSRDDQGALPK